MARNNKRADPGRAGSLYVRLGGKLGVSRIRSDRDLVNLIEKQLPVTAIKALVRSGMSDAEVYELIVPRRTLAHRVANRQPLSKEESDKAVRVARITAAAEQVFGETERAWRWLRMAKQRFDGKTPIEMLATEPGARLVEETILQFEHGMTA